MKPLLEVRGLTHRYGARMACEKPPAAGLEVMIRWGSFDAFGMVVWSSLSTFGVRFFDPIGPEVLIATRDTDDAEHICSRTDLSRREAQAFVNGTIRR